MVVSTNQKNSPVFKKYTNIYTHQQISDLI